MELNLYFLRKRHESRKTISSWTVTLVLILLHKIQTIRIKRHLLLLAIGNQIFSRCLVQEHSGVLPIFMLIKVVLEVVALVVQVEVGENSKFFWMVEHLLRFSLCFLLFEPWWWREVSFLYTLGRSFGNSFNLMSVFIYQKNKGRGQGGWQSWNFNEPQCQLCGRVGHVVMQCYYRFYPSF